MLAGVDSLRHVFSECTGLNRLGKLHDKLDVDIRREKSSL